LKFISYAREFFFFLCDMQHVWSGFATYVEYLGVEAVQPQIRLLEQFIVSEIQVWGGGVPIEGAENDLYKGLA
jgi:hypothetical protein